MSKKNIKVSKKYVKNQFSFVGLCLLLYFLLVLALPISLKLYFDMFPISFNGSAYLKVGILYAIVVVGTIIPFGILKQGIHIKLKDFWRKCSFSFKDIIYYTIVYTAIGTILIFITSIINNYFYLGNEMITSIGISMPKEYLINPLYLFLFVVATPILEEIAFRGILLRVLGRYGNRFGMYSVSLIFAMFHITFADAFTSFFLSIVLIKLTLCYRSVQPSIIIHILFNLIIYILELVPSNYYYINATVILIIYLAAFLIIILRLLKFTKIKKKKSDKKIYRLFYSRFTVLITLILTFIYTIICTFFYKF